MGQAAYKDYWKVSRAFTEADHNATTAALEIPAKTLVRSVGVLVTEALAGGTPSIDVGDGDDPDGWVDTLDVTETGAGTIYAGGTANSPYVRQNQGRYYAAADTLDIVLSSGLTDGTCYVVAHCLDLSGAL